MARYLPKGPPPGGHAVAWALPNFDQEAFDATETGRNMAEMERIYTAHPDEEMHPDVLAYWAERGARKELFEADTDGKYSVFTPTVMQAGRLYPLVYISHGGRTPINRSETTGFTELVARENLIIVYPWNGGPSNDEVESEFPRILGELDRRGYPIDHRRIYAVGYSAGSDATGVLATAYPDILAAVSPDPGGNLFAKGRWFADPDSYDLNKDVRLPFICVGGTMDGGDVYPLRDPDHFTNLAIWLEHVAKASGFEVPTIEAAARLAVEGNDSERAFGMRFDRTFAETFEDMTWVFGDYLGDDAIAVARFVAGVGLPHAQPRYHSPIIWDFLRHFERDTTTGTSVYHPVVLDGVR